MLTSQRVIDYSSGPPRIDPRDLPEEPGPMNISLLGGISIVCSAMSMMFCGVFAYAHHESMAGEAGNVISMAGLFMLAISTVLLLAAWATIPYWRLRGLRRRRDAVLALAVATLALSIVIAVILHSDVTVS